MKDMNIQIYEPHLKTYDVANIMLNNINKSGGVFNLISMNVLCNTMYYDMYMIYKQ